MTPQIIIEKVAEAFDVSQEDITGLKRGARYTLARAAVVACMVHFLGADNRAIGKALRHEASIPNLRRMACRLERYDASYRGRLTTARIVLDRHREMSRRGEKSEGET